MAPAKSSVKLGVQMIIRRSFMALVLAGLAGMLILDLASSTGDVEEQSMDQPSTIPVVWVAPPGVIKLSECVPYMGEHWANPANMPLGPIYTVDNGRLISIEYMFSHADLAAGKSWWDLKFLYWGRELAIQHADVAFLPQGHDGYEVPHFDMHFYLVTHEEDRAITC